MGAAKGAPQVVMVGPDPSGKGGISRVVSVWQGAGILGAETVQYVASVGGDDEGRVVWLLRALWRFVLVMVSRPELVYVHTASNRSFFRKTLFILVAKIWRCRVVLHVHPTAFWVRFLPGLRGLSRHYAMRLLNAIDVFVVLTEGQAEMVRTAFPGAPVYVLNNPVDVQGLSDGGRFQRKPNSLLYLGWYVREKGVFELVDAVGLLRARGLEVELDCYGTMGAKELADYVRARGLDGVVRVNGWIGVGEKIEALHKTAVFVFPSHNEGVPNAVLEAMATGTPIVSTLAGGLAEVLRNGENSLIAEINNPTDLANQIARCLQDGELRARIGKAAKRDTEERYDVTLAGKRLLSILKEASLP